MKRFDSKNWYACACAYVCVCILKGKLICIHRVFKENDSDILNDNVARTKTKNTTHIHNFYKNDI